MKAQSMKLVGIAAALLASAASGCGDVARSGRSPVIAVISALEGASGATPSEMGGTLRSDVVTLIERDDELGGDYYSTYNDLGEVTMRLILKDPGVPGITATPTPLNDVTFYRYRVSYRRADGRNTPGVDVPYPFDSAITFTVPSAGEASFGFDLVRHTAKDEAPLKALAESPVIISTIAEVSFYGRDQAGNDVSVTGNIGIFFGNFADPQ